MTDPVTPPATPATPAAAPASTALTNGWASLDSAGRTIVGGGIAVAAGAIIGIAVGAWSLDGLGLVMLVAGLAVATIAWLAAAGVRSWPIAPPWLEFAAALIALDVALINGIELLFDLDQLDDLGGPIGALVAVVVVVVAGAVFLTTARRADVLRVDAWLVTPAVRLASIGAAIVFIAVTLQVSVGLLNFNPTLVHSIVATLLALVTMRAAADPGGVRLPFPAGWLAIAFAAVAVLLAFSVLGSYQRNAEFLDVGDWLFLLVHGIGVAVVVIAALASAGLPLPVRRVPPAE